MTLDLRRSCLEKKRYATEAIANAVIVAIADAGGDALRAYRCDACQGFHLTKTRVVCPDPRWTPARPAARHAKARSTERARAERRRQDRRRAGGRR